MSLRRDEGCIYLCFLLRPVGFCFSKILHLCHLGVTKSACPTAAEKCLSTAICPYSRWRSQPLSRVSRKQRYNTLDFASKIVCQQGGSRPYWKPSGTGNIPCAIPHFPHRCIDKLQKAACNACSKNAKEAVLSHDTRVAELLSFIGLQHQIGFAKSVQYLH